MYGALVCWHLCVLDVMGRAAVSESRLQCSAKKLSLQSVDLHESAEAWMQHFFSQLERAQRSEAKPKNIVVVRQQWTSQRV